MGIDPISIIAGGVIGYALKDGRREPQPVTWAELIKYLESAKPITEEIVSLDASTSRSDEAHELVGDFILVEHYPSTVPFFIRLNEKTNAKDDLSKLLSIEGPFACFYISNVAGNGNVKLHVCRGIRLTPKLFGIEELANRIIYGVPMSFDNRGQIIWADNFEDNINKWSYAPTGAGGSAALSLEAAHSGAKSAKLLSGDTAEGPNTLSRYLFAPVLSKVGVEMSFALSNSIFYVRLDSIPDNDNLGRYGGVRYRPTPNTLEYLDSANTWQTLATGIDLYEAAHAWHTLKLVIDLETNKYVWVLLNERSWDMSAIPLRTATTTGAPAWLVRPIVASADASNRAVYIDDVIVTQNE